LVLKEASPYLQVLDLDTKRPRGFGFVSLHNPNMVKECLEIVEGDCEFREDGHVVQVRVPRATLDC